MAVWLAASGDLEIVCDDADGTASIAARMTDLIPHGVYTMWGNWTDVGGDVLSVPIGGLPNTIVADRNGTAEFCRQVQFCPLDLAPDSHELQFLSAVYMGSGMTFGAVPYEAFNTYGIVGYGPLPFLSSIPGGIISFDHLGFRINATGGPDPGPTSPLMCSVPAVPAASLSPWGRGLLSALIVFSAGAVLRRSRPTGSRS